MCLNRYKLAILLPVAVLLLACNPFEVSMTEPDSGSRQRPAASMDIPTHQVGSAQVSVGDSTLTGNQACAPHAR